MRSGSRPYVLLVSASVGSGHGRATAEPGRRLREAGCRTSSVDVVHSGAGDGRRLSHRYAWMLRYAPVVYDLAMRFWERWPSPLEHLVAAGAHGVVFVLQAGALSTGEVSEAQPLLALELPVTLLVASRVFHRHLHRRDWAAITAMAAGMSAFLFAVRPSGGHPAAVSALARILSI
ncbi:hypothetical protein FOE78_08935 [Microlunatus elymi]|uniref:Uncharacterized protein n=1 Tax=Microlunatus elymi TaxID=2596828 RepID=A0A516PXW4_9ACTN|nr:hypothetical protein [Microlunatus elymi]QDP96006.1 hypothetical protein FOE78_08935 [Microlunatus elymi]